MKSYKCEICGKTYNTIEERMQCESKCIQEQKDKEKEVAAAQLKQSKNELLDRIKESIRFTESLLAEYKEKYGEEPNMIKTYKVYSDGDRALDDVDWPFPDSAMDWPFSSMSAALRYFLR